MRSPPGQRDTLGSGRMPGDHPPERPNSEGSTLRRPGERLDRTLGRPEGGAGSCGLYDRCTGANTGPCQEGDCHLMADRAGSGRARVSYTSSPPSALRM